MGNVNVKGLLAVFLAFLLIASFFVAIAISTYLNNPPKTDSGTVDVFVGVDASFATVAEMKAIIDEVKSYTNLFVVGSTAITNDLANISQVCQYLNDSGLHFMTFAHPAVNLTFSQVQWFKEARQLWNQSFIGLYAYDEPGGHQIDHDEPYMVVTQADNYTNAADWYVKNLTLYLSGVKDGWEIGNFPYYTSDYALHEFDYRAGYSAVFSEFAWNHSRTLSIALGRGAATVHNREWGIMITRSINDTVTESGEDMYSDMVLAYENGAKYILLFDYPTFANGILSQEHFDALRQFWQYAQTHPRISKAASERVAYVVPTGYGYGFRGPNDKIWGLWENDSQSGKIWNDVTILAQKYGSKLDIIYEDALHFNIKSYTKLIFWNGTIQAPTE
jgi:hypothetical protein